MIKAILVLLSFVSVAHAEVEAEFDKLGGNQILLEKAKELNPETKIEIVQDRTVSRIKRLEIAPEFSGTMGGDDTYNKTQSVGLNLNYHVNHHWSVGLKYNYSFNKLTAEGESMVDKSYADYLRNPKNPSLLFPEIDYQKSETLALVNWYPIYGKMNLFDRAIAQFDLYALFGLGQVELASGKKDSYSIGGGVGFWINQKLTTRFELRYEKYKVEYYTGPKSLDLAIASFQMGWLM